MKLFSSAIVLLALTGLSACHKPPSYAVAYPYHAKVAHTGVIYSTNYLPYPTYDYYPCRVYQRSYLPSGYWAYTRGYRPSPNVSEAYYRRYLC